MIFNEDKTSLFYVTSHLLLKLDHFLYFVLQRKLLYICISRRKSQLTMLQRKSQVLGSGSVTLLLLSIDFFFFYK